METQIRVYDTVNLRSNADFEIPISHELYWVPLNRLGNTQYSQNDIQQIVELRPNEKQNQIHSVYEAVQLLQNCNFHYYSSYLCNSEKIGDKVWIHHKPGFISVLTNTGCCTDLATWLDYMIQNIYPNRGYLWFFRSDSSSHVLNYILHQGNYYILDATAMLADKAVQCCPETGIKREYLHSHYPTGICFKCKDLNAFVKFHSRILKCHDHSFLYTDVFSYPAIPPISTKIEGDYLNVYFSFTSRILQESAKINCYFEEQFSYSPNWNLYLKTLPKEEEKGSSTELFSNL